jgi:hypothetical protein
MTLSNGFEFLEPLPDSCPPIDIVVPTQKVLWRLIKSEAPGASDFDSQRKRLPTRPYPNECTARSVSLVTSLAACRAAVKSPRMVRMKFSHAVQVPCDPALGVWDKDGQTHVNWWPFHSVNPLSVVADVEKLDG